jgi:nitrogen fixation/metabolism regulation signal transduction histidine kinase
LSNFLSFLEENDTTLAFSKRRIEKSFKDLSLKLDRVNDKLRNARLEKEKQFQYLQAVIKQIDSGIIAFNEEGKIEICNQTAKELLGIRNLKHIKDITESFPEFAGLLRSVKRNMTPVKVWDRDKQKILAIKTSLLRFDTSTIKIISLQNIKPELEAKELEAWKKLLRIQRHEIINSITPITTLTTAIKRRFISDGRRKNTEILTDDLINDVLRSIDVIEDRSTGLIEFMERLRKMTDIPVLKPERFHLIPVLDQLRVLFERSFESKDIRFRCDLNPADISVYGDMKLLEQVLINLIKNAIEAIHEPGKMIIIRADKDHDMNVIIRVIDTGAGIEKELLDSIFVPSFTTKENGSGLGLSITRQIIQQHKGTIEVRSEPGKETIFQIVLPPEF